MTETIGISDTSYEHEAALRRTGHQEEADAVAQARQEEQIKAQYGITDDNGIAASAWVYPAPSNEQASEVGEREPFDSAPTEHEYLRASLDHINYAVQHGKSFSFRKWAHRMMSEMGIDGSPDEDASLDALVAALEDRIRNIERDAQREAEEAERLDTIAGLRTSIDEINTAVREGRIKTFMRGERFAELQQLTGAESLDDVVAGIEERIHAAEQGEELSVEGDTTNGVESAHVPDGEEDTSGRKEASEHLGDSPSLEALLTSPDVAAAIKRQLTKDLEELSPDELEQRYRGVAAVLGVSDVEGLQMALTELSSRQSDIQPSAELGEMWQAEATPESLVLPEAGPRTPTHEAFISLADLRAEREKWIAEFELGKKERRKQIGNYRFLLRSVLGSQEERARDDELFETIESLDVQIELTKRIQQADSVDKLLSALRSLSPRERLYARSLLNPFNQNDASERFDLDGAIQAVLRCADGEGSIKAVPEKYGIQAKLRELLGSNAKEEQPSRPPRAEGEARRVRPETSLTPTVEEQLAEIREHEVALLVSLIQANENPSAELLKDRQFLQQLEQNEEFVTLAQQHNRFLHTDTERTSYTQELYEAVKRALSKGVSESDDAERQGEASGEVHQEASEEGQVIEAAARMDAPQEPLRAKVEDDGANVEDPRGGLLSRLADAIRGSSDDEKTGTKALENPESPPVAEVAEVEDGNEDVPSPEEELRQKIERIQAMDEEGVKGEIAERFRELFQKRLAEGDLSEAWLASDAFKDKVKEEDALLRASADRLCELLGEEEGRIAFFDVARSNAEQVRAHGPGPSFEKKPKKTRRRRRRKRM